MHDLRGWTRDRHRTVDDTPLGGGAGMVMKPDVWGEALDEVLALAADVAATRIAAVKPARSPGTPPPNARTKSLRVNRSRARKSSAAPTVSNVFRARRYYS